MDYSDLALEISNYCIEKGFVIEEITVKDLIEELNDVFLMEQE